MDWSVILTGLTVIGFVYGFLRNFKIDIHRDIEAMNRRMDLQDERIFLLATGKTLQQAMVEAKMNQENHPNGKHES